MTLVRGGQNHGGWGEPYIARMGNQYTTLALTSSACYSWGVYMDNMCKVVGIRRTNRGEEDSCKKIGTKMYARKPHKSLWPCQMYGRYKDSEDLWEQGWS